MLRQGLEVRCGAWGGAAGEAVVICKLKVTGGQGWGCWSQVQVPALNWG